LTKPTESTFSEGRQQGCKGADPRTWDGFFENREGYWGLFLLFFAIAAHAYSIVVTGAKYWIDSIVYIQLALALFDADQLGRLYNSEFGFLYQHTEPGLPLLIRALDLISRGHLWPALAIFQGLLSAAAVTYFVLAFRTKLGRPAQLAAVVICSLHPYFVSFHAAALTESVSASILLISLGVAIRALDGRISLHASLTLLLPLSIVAAQFRPYLGLVGILAAVLIVFQRGRPWRMPLYAATALALAIGTLAFPLYRTALGIGFFLPNVSTLLLTHASHVAWDLDEETANSLKSVVLNDEIRTRLIGKQPINYDDARHIFDDLVASGLSPAEARQKIAAAAWRVRTSSIGAIERQLQLPLASIGFQYAPACCWPNRQLTRDITAGTLFRNARIYFRWNSGVDNGSYSGGNYLQTFDRFSEMTRSSHVITEEAQAFYISRIRPYVTESLKRFRDPLHLAFFVSDPLIVAGWYGLFLCFWPRERTTLLLMFIPFAVIYAAAAYAHIAGDNRHAHPLIPIIIVGFMKVADEFLARNHWSRLRSGYILSYSKALPSEQS
jgi:hypothetical protein